MTQFMISGFADEAGKTADEQIRVLKLNGLHYIEVRAVDGKNVIDMDIMELRALKAKLTKNKIGVSAIGSPIGKTPISEDFAPVRAAFERALTAAEILGTPNIRAFSFYPPKDPRVRDPKLWESDVVSRIEELVQMASSRFMRYSFENESGIYTDIPDRCTYILARIPKLRMAFDPGNFIMNDADPLAAWKILKNRVSYFHIKDGIRNPRRFVPAGEGEGKMAAILKAAVASGFDGFLSVEPHLGYMKELNDAQRFTYAVNALKKLLNDEFQADLKLVDLNDMCG